MSLGLTIRPAGRALRGRGKNLVFAYDPAVRARLAKMKPERAAEIAREIREELLALPRQNGRDGYGHILKGTKLKRGKKWKRSVGEASRDRCAQPAYRVRLLAQLAAARQVAFARLATRPRHKGKFVKAEVTS
jgi:hypothetical protein